jgi:hypothetical protein
MPSSQTIAAFMALLALSQVQAAVTLSTYATYSDTTCTTAIPRGSQDYISGECTASDTSSAKVDCTIQTTYSTLDCTGEANANPFGACYISGSSSVGLSCREVDFVYQVTPDCDALDATQLFLESGVCQLVVGYPILSAMVTEADGGSLTYKAYTNTDCSGGAQATVSNQACSDDGATRGVQKLTTGGVGAETTPSDAATVTAVGATVAVVAAAALL